MVVLPNVEVPRYSNFGKPPRIHIEFKNYVPQIFRGVGIGRVHFVVVALYLLVCYGEA